MLFPTLSVTVIGLLVTLVAARKRPRPAMLARGVAGAWLGFVAGAVVGVVGDVLDGDGSHLALFGHVAAALGAVLAVGPAGGRALTRLRRRVRR